MSSIVAGRLQLLLYVLNSYSRSSINTRRIQLYKDYDIRLYVFQDVANVRRKIVGEILFKSNLLSIFPLSYWYSSKSKWLDTYRYSDSQMPPCASQNKQHLEYLRSTVLGFEYL